MIASLALAAVLTWIVPMISIQSANVAKELPAYTTRAVIKRGTFFIAIRTRSGRWRQGRRNQIPPPLISLTGCSPPYPNAILGHAHNRFTAAEPASRS